MPAANLTAMDIKFLFTLEELGNIMMLSNEPKLNQILRILDDPNFTIIQNSDQLFVEGVNHLEYLGVLTPDRTARVLSGQRPL